MKRVVRNRWWGVVWWGAVGLLVGSLALLGLSGVWRVMVGRGAVGPRAIPALGLEPTWFLFVEAGRVRVVCEKPGPDDIPTLESCRKDGLDVIAWTEAELKQIAVRRQKRVAPGQRVDHVFDMPVAGWPQPWERDNRREAELIDQLESEQHIVRSIESTIAMKMPSRTTHWAFMATPLEWGTELERIKSDPWREVVGRSKTQGRVSEWSLSLVPVVGVMVLVVVFVRRVGFGYGAGFCGGCGYDLRGSPGRCPECGVGGSARVGSGDGVGAENRGGVGRDSVEHERGEAV